MIEHDPNDMSMAPAPARELTFGEKAVGLTFNPSSLPDVDLAKRTFAASIDQANELQEKATSQEQWAMCEQAIRRAQEAQMWLVKAITWRG